MLEHSQRGRDPGLCLKPSHFMERGGFSGFCHQFQHAVLVGRWASEKSCYSWETEYNISRSELPPGAGYAGINETITKRSALCTDRGVICLDSGLNMGY